MCVCVWTNGVCVCERERERERVHQCTLTVYVLVNVMIKDLTCKLTYCFESTASRERH